MMPTSVAIHVDIPLAWKPGPVTSTVDGVLLLRVLAMLEAAPPHFDEDESVDALRWQALEARVDLCVQMLGQLLANHEPRAPHHSVMLSGEACTWLASHPITLNELGSLGLNFSPRIPQALWLPATVTACEAEGSSWRITTHFRITDDELQDWLDKTIFRHHRREISERKRHAPDGESIA